MVRPGKTVALVGGDVSFAGGVVTAPVGRIEVGAVEQGTVGLTQTPAGWQLDYRQVEDFQDVSLSDRTSLWNPYPGGNLFGGIQVVGRDISLDKSQIVAATTGTQPGGSIRVNAQRNLSLGGIYPYAAAPSAWIANQVTQGASGAGGKIEIRAGQLSLQDGAAIETFSLGSGSSGNIEINANSIFAEGSIPTTSPLLPFGNSSSRISTTAYAVGPSGNITVNAPQITLINSGRISTLVLPGAAGKGGDITVTATDITADGTDSDEIIASGVGSYSLGLGDSGDITISTDTLALLDSGAIVALTARIAGIPASGTGQAGDIQITAREGIKVSGFSPAATTLVSAIASGTAGAGSGGDITLKTPTLVLEDGAFVGSNTLPVVGFLGDVTQADQLGDSGNVSIDVSEKLTISGINPLSGASSVVGSQAFGGGAAGEVNVRANQLWIRDGGVITSLTAASGNAGTVNIQAEDILVEGFQRVSSSISASAFILPETTRQFYGLPDVPSGDTGSLSIRTNTLTVRDNGTISIQHQGSGNAGQLTIQANDMRLDSGFINARTAAGNGGNIDLNVKDLFLLRNNSTVVAAASNAGNGGNISINSPFIVGLGNSDIIASAVQGEGGNIRLMAQGILGLTYRDQLTAENDITASSEFGVDGTVEINQFNSALNSSLVKLPESLADSNSQVAQGCQANSDNKFVITGRGGLPADPRENVNGNTAIWVDLRDLSDVMTAAPDAVVSELVPTVSEPTVPLEAAGWQTNAAGQVELISVNSAQASSSAFASCAVSGADLSADS